MADKLGIYNGSLRLLGERALASLAEDRPSRYYLDEAYSDDLIKGCLEDGYWSHATRSVMLVASASLQPEFGYRYGFQKPDDYIKLKAISLDEFFRNTLHQYTDEADYWFCDYDVIYVQYISNDPEYGLNMGKWTKSFSDFVEAKLADSVKGLITGSDGKDERIKRALKEAKKDARSKDAMNRPVKFGQSGTWVSARMRGVVDQSGNRIGS